MSFLRRFFRWLFGESVTVKNYTRMTISGRNQSVSCGNGWAEINGRRYTFRPGASIRIANGRVYVDGKRLGADDEGDSEIGSSKQVSISLNGEIGCLSVDGDLVVENGDIHGDVEAKGSIQCDDIYGSVQAGGSVECDDVEGDVTAGGSVNCDDVGGNVVANGAVIM